MWRNWLSERDPTHSSLQFQRLGFLCTCMYNCACLTSSLPHTTTNNTSLALSLYHSLALLLPRSLTLLSPSLTLSLFSLPLSLSLSLSPSLTLCEWQHEMQMMWSQGKTLGVSKLRFLPKQSGVRPIINLKSCVKTGSGAPGYSINYHLQNPFHVLALEKVCLTSHPPEYLPCVCIIPSFPIEEKATPCWQCLFW